MISRFKNFLLNVFLFALLCMGAVVGGQEASAQTHAAPQKSASGSFGISITVVAPTPAPTVEFVAPTATDYLGTWTSGYGKSMARTYKGVIYAERTLVVGKSGCQWACGYGHKIPGTNFDPNWTN